MSPTWQPAAGLSTLRARAQLYQQLRHFFDQRGVLEVVTPVLGRSTATDLHLRSYRLEGEPGRYLQTSPEFFMKRLLAAGSGPIFQLGPCFRDGESSARHNPEFTMLEWYRPAYSLQQLIDEVAELVSVALPLTGFEQRSYRELFQQRLGIDPHRASTAEIAALAGERLDIEVGELRREEWLDLLMSHLIEPGLGGERGWFVVDFPASQASLSRVEEDAQGEPVARRFELFINGMEIANGYDELLDADELARRFDVDNAARRQAALPGIPRDERLLGAQRAGLPASCGVALGVDRLLMAQLGVDTIARVLAFPDDRC